MNPERQTTRKRAETQGPFETTGVLLWVCMVHMGFLWVYLGLYTQSDLEPSPMFIGKHGYSDGLPMDVENYEK